jgi:hypothetical protein
MSILPVAASNLCRRAVQLADRYLAEATLFPFFDRAGVVQVILLLTPASDEILVLPWSRELVSVPFRGSICIAAGWADLRGVAGSVSGVLLKAWHFDPRWVLKEEPYVFHRMMPELTLTNCAGRCRKKIKMLYFRRDLSRVSLYAGRDSEAIVINCWDSELLPDQPAAAALLCAAKARHRVWALDPIWQ